MHTDINKSPLYFNEYVNKYGKQLIAHGLYAASLFAVLFFGNELIASSAFVSAFAFFPFFRLGGCSCSSGGASCSGPGGSGEGSSDGDCTSVGVGNIASTPFVSVWNGERYRTENDVLVAHQTWYSTAAKGREHYENGEGGSDVYPLQTTPDRSRGKIWLQLKEFEPEESFIDTFSLSRIAFPAKGTVVQNTGNSGLKIFDTEEMATCAGVSDVRAGVYKRDGTTKRINTNFESDAEELFLEAGEYIELDGTVTGKEERTNYHVLIRSRYRDWAAGRIAALEEKVGIARGSLSPMQLFRSPKMFSKALVLLLAAVFTWTVGSTATKTTTQEDMDLLAKTAHASDTTSGGGLKNGGGSGSNKSLLVAYWDWEKREYVHTGTVHPRYKTATLNAVAFPKAASNSDGRVRIRITATRRHAVSLASLFGATNTYTYTETTLPLNSAQHSRTGNDHTQQLAAREHTEYVHIIPGDVLHLEFENTVPEEDGSDMHEMFVVNVRGFYTPLSKESARVAGEWVSRLDADAYGMLSEMYSMRSRV